MAELQAMWWVAKLQGRATGPRVPSAPYKLTNCRLSYGVDYGLYMFSSRARSARRRTSRAGSWRGRPWRWPARSARRTRLCFVGRALRARRRRGRLRDRAARTSPSACAARDELHLRPDPVLLRGRERLRRRYRRRGRVAIPAARGVTCLVLPSGEVGWGRVPPA